MSAANTVFQRLKQQVETVRKAAGRELSAGNADSAAALLRSCVVLAVAALDAFMHEQGTRILEQHAKLGATEAKTVIGYLGKVTEADVTGKSAAAAERYIRYRLSYKTLVAPDKIDQLLVASGLDADDTWLHVAIALGSRPERLRMQVQLLFDRRNQIAHEGDWDYVGLCLRAIEPAHADECLSCIDGLVTQMDAHVP